MVNIAIFVSGNGTNCENIIRHFAGSGVELVLCPYPYFGSNATREGVAEILSLKPNSPLLKM